MTDPRLLTFDEVAIALAVSKRQVRRYVSGGALPVVRLSRNVARVRAADLAAFIAARLTTGGRGS